MSAAAKYVWQRVISEQAPGVILAVDRDMLRVYCEAVVRYEESAVLYAESSPLVSTRGNLVKNPLHQVVRDNADQVRQLAHELGLSPSARANMRFEQGPSVPELDDVLGPPRLSVVAGGRSRVAHDDPTLGPRFAIFCEHYIIQTKGRWGGKIPTDLVSRSVPTATYPSPARSDQWLSPSKGQSQSMRGSCARTPTG